MAHYLVLTNQAEAKAAEANSGAAAAPAINSAAAAADVAVEQPAGKKPPSSIRHLNEASVTAL